MKNRKLAGNGKTGQSTPQQHQVATIKRIRNNVATADLAQAPPLKSRIQINRENALKSTGPTSDEGKARSRMNALKHGCTSQIALPETTSQAIATQFWQLVMAYKPTDAVGVHAIFDLAQNYWKNRVLFEQFASQHAMQKLTATDDRLSRQKRQAQRQFSRLREDTRSSLVKLRQTCEGMQLIVDSLNTLIDELKLPDGGWSTSQFEMAVNLCGYTVYDIWDNPGMRQVWSAWYGCFPDQSVPIDEAISYLMPGPEFEYRVQKAKDDAPEPHDARQFLVQWASELRSDYENRLEMQTERENELESYVNHASTWPGGRDGHGHLLHLRYSSQVDRKIRELLIQINDSPRHCSGFPYEFRDDFLPEPWSELLLNCKPEKSLLSFQGSQMQIHEPPLNMQHERVLTFDTIDQGLDETVRENESCPHCQGKYHSSNCGETSDRNEQVFEIQTVAEQLPEPAVKTGNGLNRLSAVIAAGNDKQKIKEAMFAEPAPVVIPVTAAALPPKSDTEQRRNDLIENLNTVIGQLKIEIAEKTQNDDPGLEKCRLDLAIAEKFLAKINETEAAKNDDARNSAPMTTQTTKCNLSCNGRKRGKRRYRNDQKNVPSLNAVHPAEPGEKHSGPQ